MKTLAQAAGVLVLVIAGSALALYLQSRNVIPSRPSPAGQPTVLQVTGEPNVTVSDGSLHVKSLNGWKTDNAGDTKLEPVGMLVAGCKMKDSTGNKTAASLFADDQIYDINPGDTVTIVHDVDTGMTQADASIEITVPMLGQSGLTITTAKGSFEKSKGKKHSRFNRQHSRDGEVESITINHADPPTWKPANFLNPHFTLMFCYQ